MLESRRGLLLGLVGAAGFISSRNLLTADAAQYPPPRPTPPSSDPTALAGTPKHANSHVLTAKDQQLLKSDLDRLLQLASELQKEYQAADPNAVLSVTFMKNAEQAEKLAKQVKNLARG
jgi:hypothetical protein